MAVAALGAAEAEERRIAERQRDDRRGKLLLVPVLVQPHPGVGVVEIDETGLRRRRVGTSRIQMSTSRAGMSGHARPVSGWVGW